MIDLYEIFTECPLALLDEVFEFKKKYIFGCVDSDEDRKLATLWEFDIDGRIAHPKDKVKAAGISFWGRNPLAKELRSLRAAKAKIKTRLAHFQEQAKEGYINLRSEDWIWSGGGIWIYCLLLGSIP